MCAVLLSFFVQTFSILGVASPPLSTPSPYGKLSSCRGAGNYKIHLSSGTIWSELLECALLDGW